MRQWVRPVAGAILLVVGVIWSMQGSGAMGHGGMSGQSQWLIIGVIVAVVGLVLLGGSIARRLRGGRA